MVKNREELLQVAQSNASQLKNHLRSAVRDFLKVQRVTPDELAYVLGITNDEMLQIIEGDGNITVDVLSKLLVATDMAVEIKPVRNTPLGAYGPKMPRSGGFPGPNGIPVDEDGRPLPPPPGWCPEMMPGFGSMPHRAMRGREERAADDMREVPMETSNRPLRDSHGRFVKRPTAQRRAATQRTGTQVANPYMNIPSSDLANIIRSNIWDGEIDINNASHEQLAAFVANKERIMRERTENHATQHVEQPKADNTVKGGNQSFNQFIEMLGNVAREAENNPALMDAIQRFMPKK